MVANLEASPSGCPSSFLPLAASGRQPSDLGADRLFTAFAAHRLGCGREASTGVDQSHRALLSVDPAQALLRHQLVHRHQVQARWAPSTAGSCWRLSLSPSTALSFTLAIVFITLSWIFLELVREPARPIPDRVVEQRGRSWRKIRNIVRTDENCLYLLVRLLAAFGTQRGLCDGGRHPALGHRRQPGRLLYLRRCSSARP
ncbi:MAG: hypothetical protein R2851_22070 [Caldilineaceae bacterium]